MRKRPWLACFLILGVIAATAWAGYQARTARQFRATLDQVKQEIAAKKYGSARKRLMDLGRSRDATGEVDYQLGICELYRGHPELARAAWKRVPPRARWRKSGLAVRHAGDQHGPVHLRRGDSASPHSATRPPATQPPYFKVCSFFSIWKDGPTMSVGRSWRHGQNRTRRRTS